MSLSTKRLNLRHWEESDAADLYEYAKDPLIGIQAGWPPHIDVFDSLYVINNILKAPETYAICLHEDNRAVGSVALLNQDEANLTIKKDEAEIGYWIGRPFWGKGYVPEAVSELSNRAFYELGIKRIWCCHFEGNTNSQRVMEKCGFVYDHTLKNQIWGIDGELKTLHVYVLESHNLA